MRTLHPGLLYQESRLRSRFDKTICTTRSSKRMQQYDDLEKVQRLLDLRFSQNKRPNILLTTRVDRIGCNTCASVYQRSYSIDTSSWIPPQARLIICQLQLLKHIHWIVFKTARRPTPLMSAYIEFRACNNEISALRFALALVIHTFCAYIYISSTLDFVFRHSLCRLITHHALL